MDIKFEPNGGAYNLNTNVSNGGSSKYLATSTWCDGTATPWTFTAVEGEDNTYSISNNSSYLVANDALNDVVYGESTGDNKSWWKLVSLDDFKTAMRAKAYSATDPMDVSVFIKGRSFARNDGRNSSWTTTHNGGNWTWIGASANKYFGNEAWNNTFSVSQTIENLPDGTYEVQCSGFGTNGTTYIFGNFTSKAIQSDNTTSRGTSKEAKWTAIHEDNAFAGQTTGTFTLSGGTLNLGLKRETNKGGDWAIWDEFRLYYYGLDLSEFAATLAAAVAAAEAVDGTVPTAAYNALAAVVTENNKTYTTAAEYTTAANAIVEATNTAKALQTNYARYNSVKAAILAIKSDIDLTEAQNAADAATTNEAIDAAVVSARTALANYLAGAGIVDDNIDLTAALIDNAAPGTSGNMNYWTNSADPGLQYNLYEFYNKPGATSKQTIATQLPAGYYTLTVVGYTREGYDAFMNAGSATQTLVGVASGTVNNRDQGNNWIANGNGVNEMTFQLTEATSNLEIGITAGQTGDRWTVWRSFKLEYLGTTPLQIFKDRLAAAAATAESHATELNGQIPAAASTAYSTAINTAKATNSTFAECEQSIQTIENATAAADALVAPYAAYKAMVTKAEAAGVASDVVSAQNTAVEEATTVDAIQACTGALQRACVVIAIGENTNVDLTSFVDNGDFEQGNLTGWTSVDGGNVANNNNFSRKGGTWYAERWKNGTALGSGSLTHENISLPAGVYQITVDAQNIEQYNGGAAGKGLFLQANSDKVEIGAAANYSVYVKLTGDDAVLSIKLVQDNCTGNWISYDNVKLIYVAADFPALTVVEGKMNATVAATQTSAKGAFEENATGTNYVALSNAIAAAQASKDAYTAAAAALTKANSILNSTNVYTAEARTTYVDAIAAAQAAYDDASMEDATANGLNAALNTAGWGAAQPTGAAYIGSAWTGTNINSNFWSWEGDGENASGMSTPFIQAWVENTEKLADNNINASLSGLDNGLYRVTAFMRVFNNKEGDNAGYDGISLVVNDGTPVAFAEATEYTDGYAKEITAEGLVKDGNLVIKVAIEKTNASWVAFKNVNYTKVRDLNPEEMLVAPTAITLMNGETAVTEPIALDAENLTVTLTPAYEPANASEGYVEWTTSDASVATVENGVVTAVSTGTATITATSTIDGEVSASATVNVTFPESVYASSQTIENDNDTRTTYTLGENIIKNGSFEYPTNAVFGWTTGTGSVNAMNAANFNIPTEGSFNGSQYLQANTSEGGAKEHSINTSWPIEKGKKYVFSFMIKADKQCTTDLGYIGVSLSNTKGSENANKKLETPAYGTEWQEIKHVFENPEEDGFAWLVFNCRWMANKQSFDNFYLCEVLSETTTDQVTEEEAAALLATVPTGKMNAEAQAALTAAQEAFEANKTIANYKALNAVIPAATASVAAYAKLGAAITKIDAALAAATTATASTADYVAVKTAYNEGTIADADIMTNVAAAYNAVIPVIKSQTAAQADFTLAIQNQSFEYGDMTGWSAVSSSDTGVRETSNATYAAAGSDGYYLFNTWWQGVPVSQTISDLPNGEYTLTASVASDGATIYLVANAEHNDGTETYAETNIEEKQYGKDTFQDATITFLVKQGSVTIAAVGGAGGDAGVHKGYVEEGYWWYKADNFRLVKNRNLTSEEEFVAATDADYELLNGNLAKYALGFQAGEFAPYNNLALVQAIAAAKAIDQTAVNSQESVQAAAEAITSAGGIANETEVNAVYDGTFAVAAANGAPAGWTMSNNTLGGDYHSRVFNGDERLSEFNETNSALFIRFDGTNSDRGSQYFYGNTEGYTMPLKANTYYRITVDFAGWGSTGKTLRMNLKGPDGFAKSQEYKHEHKADTESGYTPQQFNIVFQTGNTEGNYVIGFQCPGNDNNKHNAVISNLRLFTEPESSATLAVTDAKYGTFIAPFAVEIPNGVTAYTIESSNGNELVLTEVESDDIAANTPVVVFSENEVNEVFNGYSLAIKDSYTVGWLTGTYEDIDAPDGKYIMQKQNDKVGFYHVDYNYLAQEGMDKPKVRANRAYLTAPADAAGARAFFFDGGETTGISAIEALANGDAQIFNVNGVQQPRLTKGLNIIVTKDGKTHKVMVK